MNGPHRQFDRRRRDGFTLVELLVVISIFVVLTTVVIGAFRTDNNDRISNAAATFKNALEGARSRAIKAGEVRGLRLLLDANDPRIVTSLAYVGSSEMLEGTLSDIVIMPASPTEPERFKVTDAGTGTWGPLMNSDDTGLIRPGCRMEIPVGSGNWYTTIKPVTDILMPDELLLGGRYQPSSWNGTQQVAIQRTNVRYHLQLAPVLLPSDPITLGPMACIDLDSSMVPSDWRPSPYLDPSYRAPLDILFSPQGTLTGVSANAGKLLHFRIAHPSDVMLARSNLSAGGPIPAGQVPADPEKGQRLVSLFPSTGAIVVSEVDPTTASAETAGYNNDFASKPFRFAVQGKEAKP
ncbi:pilus assembly FimT family protein [Planctomicrobium sp. SH664]|uniref:pilus assembly FimT family protein n=1 Tax=Planctomicrobium sp. SH664 TaxID=3448125 RepID=UPI003F5C2150